MKDTKSARKHLEVLKLARRAMEQPTAEDIPDLLDVIDTLIRLLDAVIPENGHDVSRTSILS